MSQYSQKPYPKNRKSRHTPFLNPEPCEEAERILLGDFDRAALLRLRTAAGWTQPQLAERVGVGASVVCHWERGTYVPHPRHARLLAEVFGVPLADLFVIDDEIREILDARRG